MNKVLVICGATASGKTKLAVDCAKKLKSEVISADSQLVYKGLDIGTAKPSAEEMRGVRHHMIDVVKPTESYSVSEYSAAALPILKELLSGGKIPVICGGTGFYINSLLFSFGYGKVAANSAVRKKWNDYLEKYGKEELFERLRECDLPTAEKLHVNDTKRVIRALEIYETSGRKKSDQADELIPRFNYLAVAADFPREELYERINTRVDKMFENGLIEEVKDLLAAGITENNACMQAIGYKEIVQGLKNGDNESTMRDIIKQNTRHYAKRQLTFFKKLPEIKFIEKQNANADYVTEMLNGI